MWKIGRSQLRIEDPRLLRGEASYASDRRHSGGLEMVILRSSVASARLVGLDVAAAEAMPGVVAILTGAQQAADGIGAVRPRLLHPGPDGGEMRIPDVFPLATDLLHYVGHPVAVVLAESRAMAEDAAEAIVVDHEDRASVVDPLAALEPDAPRVWPQYPDNRCFHVERGDGATVEAAMAGAAHVTRARLRISRVTAVALEPRAAMATYTAETGYRLEIGTQTPHRVASDLAPVLGEPPGRIRVVSRETGGSFGMKNSGYVEYALAAWAARRTGRPVNWTATRLESFLADAHAREEWVDAALALDADGRFLALDVRMVAGLGACMGPATTHPSVANVAGLAGVYLTPAIRVTVEGVFTNCQQVAPYRGAGRPEATFVIERMIDLAAAETGRDRIALRRQNMIPAAQMPYRTPLGWIYDSGDFPAVMDRALAAADAEGFPARRAASEARGRLRGLGIANPIEIAGGPTARPHAEYVALRVAVQGNARLVVGSCDTGQGHATAFRQIVADRLGIDPAAIELVSGDTAEVPTGTGTFGSRSLAAVSTSLIAVMAQIVEALRPVAAGLLGATPKALRFEAAAFHAPGGGSVSFLEAQAAAVEASEAAANTGAEGATFPNGCHLCEVEVDPETGAVQVVRYTVVDDVGTVVNPLLVKAQITGGVAQGLGQALSEEMIHDPEGGQVLTATLMDYAVPRAADLPGVDVLSHPVPTRANPLGVKGAGEAGTVGALAAGINAVADALASRGVRRFDMPATPSRVWQALHEARGG